MRRVLGQAAHVNDPECWSWTAGVGVEKKQKRYLSSLRFLPWIVLSCGAARSVICRQTWLRPRQGWPAVWDFGADPRFGERWVAKCLLERLQESLFYLVNSLASHVNCLLCVLRVSLLNTKLCTSVRYSHTLHLKIGYDLSYAWSRIPGSRNPGYNLSNTQNNCFNLFPAVGFKVGHLIKSFNQLSFSEVKIKSLSIFIFVLRPRFVVHKEANIRFYLSSLSFCPLFQKYCSCFKTNLSTPRCIEFT